MAKRRLTGKIVSDKMDKTVVVEVQRIKQHPKYLRRIRVHENYKAHDAENTYQIGDSVIIEESRPLSKDKHWIVIGKV
ncbi:MAG TPA: 30S ribosomal protein S17 [Candidatus Paceibacterota bacterium]